MKKIPLSGGTEFDALGVKSRYHKWGIGVRRWIKNKYRRRFRREEKKLTKDLSND